MHVSKYLMWWILDNFFEFKYGQSRENACTKQGGVEKKDCTWNKKRRESEKYNYFKINFKILNYIYFGTETAHIIFDVDGTSALAVYVHPSLGFNLQTGSAKPAGSGSGIPVRFHRKPVGTGWI